MPRPKSIKNKTDRELLEMIAEKLNIRVEDSERMENTLRKSKISVAKTLSKHGYTQK